MNDDDCYMDYDNPESGLPGVVLVVQHRVDVRVPVVIGSSRLPVDDSEDGVDDPEEEDDVGVVHPDGDGGDEELEHDVAQVHRMRRDVGDVELECVGVCNYRFAGGINCCDAASFCVIYLGKALLLLLLCKPIVPQLVETGFMHKSCAVGFKFNGCHLGRPDFEWDFQLPPASP